MAKEEGMCCSLSPVTGLPVVMHVWPSSRTVAFEKR
jgi:hypothetical protein